MMRPSTYHFQEVKSEKLFFVTYFGFLKPLKYDSSFHGEGGVRRLNQNLGWKVYPRSDFSESTYCETWN